MDKLLFKDFKSNLYRGFELIRMLNFDKNAMLSPIRIEIAPTSACNYNCWFCESHSYSINRRVKPLFMSDELIHNLFIEFRKLRVGELLFAGNGEPLLSKALLDEIKHNGKNFKIEILTNGSNLSAIDEELFQNLRFLTISLNSGNGTSHQLTHGYKGENQFPEIVRNIERLLNSPDANKKIKLNYVITTDNYEEMDDFIKMATSWDVSFMARPVKVDDLLLRTKGLGNQMLENLNKKVTQYPASRSLSNRLSLSLQLAKRACQINYKEPTRSNNLYPCYVSFYMSYIQSNGDVLLCASGQERPLGNLNEESFQSIWQKRNSLELRVMATQMHKTNKEVLVPCRNCVNVQYHSLAFHSIYSKTPLLPKLLESRGRTLNSMIDYGNKAI